MAITASMLADSVLQGSAASVHNIPYVLHHRSSDHLRLVGNFNASSTSARHAAWSKLESKARTYTSRVTKDDNISSIRAFSFRSTRERLKFMCMSEDYECSQQSSFVHSPESLGAATTDSISVEEGASTKSEKDANFTTQEIKSGFDDLKSQEVQIDLNLPRRTLMAIFTCKLCGTRTNRMINPNAYSCGTVFVQCAGCGVYHRLVDNLGLVEEYDFRKEAASNSEIG